MLEAKHKGRGRWIVVDGPVEVAGPFADKPTAETWIADHPVAAPSGAVSAKEPAPEAKAAAAFNASERLRQTSKRQEFISERASSQRTQSAEAHRAAALFDELRAVVLKHAGEDAAYRCEQELRQIAADPKREARRRQRLRESERHGGELALPVRTN